MFKKRNIRQSVVQHHDQLPFLAQKRFSALPRFRAVDKDEAGLSLFVVVLYIIDLFGVFPFVTLPGVLIPLGLFSIPLVIVVIGLQIYTSFLLGKCWIIAETLDPTISQKSRFDKYIVVLHQENISRQQIAYKSGAIAWLLNASTCTCCAARFKMENTRTRQIYPYAAISDMAYGRHISLIVTILLDLSIFATGIPSLVVASQNLQLIGHRLSDGHFYFSFCYWLIIIGILICPLMWLGSPKNMRGLAIFSVMVVASVVVLLGYCLIKAEGLRNPFQGMTNELPTFANLLSGYSVLAFQYDIHSMILTIQIDMQDKEQIKWATLAGILSSCSLAIIGTIIAAYKFGSMVTLNILEMLPRSVPLYGAIILISLQLCLSLVIGSSALFLHIENIFRVPEKFSIKRAAIRSTLIGLEVLLGEFVPKFDVLVGIVGGTITGPLIFILPPLLYRKIKEKEQMRKRILTQAAYGSLPIDLNYERLDIANESLGSSFWTTTCNRLRKLYKYSPFEISFISVVIAFGVLALVSSTYLNLLRIADLFQNNSPCFSNISESYKTL